MFSAKQGLVLRVKAWLVRQGAVTSDSCELVPLAEACVQAGLETPEDLGRTRSERCTNMPKPNKPKTLAPPKHTNALEQQLNEHKHTRVSRPARGTEPQHNTALTPFRSGKRRGWLPLA